MTDIIRTLGAAAALLVLLAGCSGGVTSFIVEQRNHQGDLALAKDNVKEAILAYRLAIEVDPENAHARAGFAQAQVAIAQQDYLLSKFDDATAALTVAAKYDPQNVRLAELRSQVEQARVKREIVLSNFPTYAETGLAIRKAYAQLHLQSNAIVSDLQRFDYSYDSSELVKAIAASKVLGSEVSRLTGRLSNYRQLVEAGSPDRGPSPLAPAASLLPLP